MALKNWPG